MWSKYKIRSVNRDRILLKAAWGVNYCLTGNVSYDKVVICEDHGGTRLEISLPLSSNVDVESLKKDLGLSDCNYIDTEYIPMKRALLILWAGENIHKVNEHEETLKKVIGKKKVNSSPIPIRLFGGGAFKLHCKSSNKGGEFERKLNDIDIVVPRSHGSAAKNLLLCLGHIFGSLHTHFLLMSDKVFNAMRRGKRWRVRGIDAVEKDEHGCEVPVIGVMDILTDEIEMRHTIDVREELKEPGVRNLYTIGLEKLLLTKCQFIEDHPKKYIKHLEDMGMSYRILPYPYFNDDKFIIGMEYKDIVDVCALLHDHEIVDEDQKSSGRQNETREQLNMQKLNQILSKDKKLRKTVRLNLEMLTQNIDEIPLKCSNKAKEKVCEKCNILLSELPESPEKWGKPWWNTSLSDVEVKK